MPWLVGLVRLVGLVKLVGFVRLVGLVRLVECSSLVLQRAAARAHANTFKHSDVRIHIADAPCPIAVSVVRATTR